MSLHVKNATRAEVKGIAGRTTVPVMVFVRSALVLYSLRNQEASKGRPISARFLEFFIKFCKRCLRHQYKGGPAGMLFGSITVKGALEILEMLQWLAEVPHSASVAWPPSTGKEPHPN